MNVAPFYPLADLPAGLPPLALAIGVFDGVHRGHQTLLAAASEVAVGRGALPAALTFDPHPAAVFSPSRVPRLLTTLPERTERLRESGAQFVVVATFDRAFAQQTPDEFVRNVLTERLRARAVVVGDDFRYGCNRLGDVSSLRAAGERYGFTVRVIPPVFVDGVPARSSVIREMVAGGRVFEAARLLGRPYTLPGRVVRGRQLGRTLGYPTANLSPPSDLLLPGTGVYAGRARVRGVWRRAAISVGTNPTIVDTGARTVEAFLMDGFNDDIYDDEIALEFVSFLRGEAKFASLAALQEQMARDVAEAERQVPRPD